MFEPQPAREKRRLLNFVLSNCTWQDGEVVATFRHPFDLLAETTAIAASAAAGNQAKSAKTRFGWDGGKRSNFNALRGNGRKWVRLASRGNENVPRHVIRPNCTSVRRTCEAKTPHAVMKNINSGARVFSGARQPIRSLFRRRERVAGMHWKFIRCQDHCPMIPGSVVERLLRRWGALASSSKVTRWSTRSRNNA